MTKAVDIEEALRLFIERQVVIGDAVNEFMDLPVGDPVGTVRAVLADSSLYVRSQDGRWVQWEKWWKV